MGAGADSRETVPLHGRRAPPRRVLIVEDDQDIREVVCEVLEGAGFGAVPAEDGLKAWEYLRRNPSPSAILLDLFMPNMNGWDLVKEIQTAPRLQSVPVVVMTASGPHWGYPSTRVLRKPVGCDQLLTALRTAIDEANR